MQQKKIKICLVSDCLAGGGAERVAAYLSVFFVSKCLDIHHVIVQDKVEYVFGGSLFNLGKLKNKSNSIFNKIKRLLVFRSYFKENNFDFIIDSRVQNHFIQEWIISRFIYKKNAFYAIHSYMLNLYFPENKWLARKIHSDKHKIVAISETIKLKIENDYGFKNIQKIYNPIDIDGIEKLALEAINLDFDYIIAAGSMVQNKQFDQLIICYSKSDLPSKNIKLVILGDGENRKSLEQLLIELNLEDKVKFVGHVKNPFAYYSFVQQRKIY